MEPEYLEPLTNADVRRGAVRSTDLLSGHVESGWRHLVRAYNTARNAGKPDTAGSIAIAIADVSAVMEYLQTMRPDNDKLTHTGDAGRPN